MTRRDQDWLSDIENAIRAISRYVADGSLSDGVVYDACRARLMEIGEAVKHIDPEVLERVSLSSALAEEPDIIEVCHFQRISQTNNGQSLPHLSTTKGDLVASMHPICVLWSMQCSTFHTRVVNGVFCLRNTDPGPGSGHSFDVGATMAHLSVSSPRSTRELDSKLDVRSRHQ